MYPLGRRIEEYAPVLAAGAIIVLNIISVLGVWHPSGTTLATLNAMGAVVLVFLVEGVPSLQYWRVRRSYRARGSVEARALIPTAGAIVDQIVGRDDLCRMLIADLRERGARPHILVGSAGTGKTAALVRITELLADKHIVPVPVRLQDCENDLDFEGLARERFFNDVDPLLMSFEEAEKIWRQLRRDRQIVVLADGLEAALLGTGAEHHRAHIIRSAIHKAHQRHLPLLIASRPQDALRGTEAAKFVLGPLSSAAAVSYLGGDGTGEDDRRIAWIVETADVAATPLYLEITRELQVKGLIERSPPSQGVLTDTLRADRSLVRLELLNTWERALIRGDLRTGVQLGWTERLAAVELLSALACVGLKHDRLDIEFGEDLEPQILTEVQRRFAAIDQRWNKMPPVQIVNTQDIVEWAAYLGLVELREYGIRFSNSLMQAYFGARLMSAALLDTNYFQKAVTYPGPGQEFLIALVLHARATHHETTAKSPRTGGELQLTSTGPGAPSTVRPDIVSLLRHAAHARDDSKVLNMYAAALEIDCFAPEPEHSAIAQEIQELWPRINAWDRLTFEESKLELVSRFGEAARTIDRRRLEDGCPATPAYRQLYEIACGEWSYPVQYAAVQEIGTGGDPAYQALRHVLAAPCQTCRTERDGRNSANRKDGPSQSRPDGDDRSSGADIMSAWLAPMLVGSVSPTGSRRADKILADQARADLAQWLRHVRQDGRRTAEEDLPISLEIALAQGFKYAANCRPKSPETLRDARWHLAGQALEMLEGTRFWFTQLTLIQALCLLQLSDGSSHPTDRPSAGPEAIVQHWLDVAGRVKDNPGGPPGAAHSIHPFVRESAMLALLALKSGRPQRFCWIDERQVAGQVGSRSLTSGQVQSRRWIPPSAGWTGLDERAQQLVADVLLLLNLAERGWEPRDHELGLRQTNRQDLPPCLTHHRPALDPARTVGSPDAMAPGMNCVADCPFQLCPYPPRLLAKVEISEAFCRNQQALLTRSSLSHRKAPWQEMRRGQLIDFWSEMANRARHPRFSAMW